MAKFVEFTLLNQNWGASTSPNIPEITERLFSVKCKRILSFWPAHSDLNDWENACHTSLCLNGRDDTVMVKEDYDTVKQKIKEAQES